MEVFILLGLIVLNGIFAMSEIALVAARKPRLAKLSEEGDGGARVALELADDPTKFMSTVQIGITSIGILNGIVGEAVLAGPIAAWLIAHGVEARHAGIAATAGVVLVVTYVSIVVGELVPKRLGQLSPETVARLVARPMRLLALATRPFVELLTGSTRFLLRLLGVRDEAAPPVTEEDIQGMLDEGAEAGVIEQQQRAMVRNLFRLDDRQLGSLMIPRAALVTLDVRSAPADNLRRVVQSEHSRFPVVDGSLQNVLGLIHAKQVLSQIAEGRELDFTRDLQPCLYVPETLTGMELLEQFRASNVQMALVVNEYGDIQGVVTVQDLLEALTGEFTPTTEAESWAVQRPDGSWLLDGAIPVPEMKDHLALKTVPEEERGNYHTVSGMIMLLLGQIPGTGDYVDWSGWRFEVVDMDGKRIDKVLAARLPELDAAGAPAAGAPITPGSATAPRR